MGAFSSVDAQAGSFSGTGSQLGTGSGTGGAEPGQAQPAATPEPATTPQPTPTPTPHAVTPPPPRRSTRPAAPKRNGTSCVRRSRSRICTTYRKGKITKRCVKKPGKRQRCTRPRSRARAATLYGHGFPNQPLQQVGKIISETAQGRGSSCSGTLVGRALMITAAHCVYGDGGYHKRIYFVPGSTQSGTSYSAPYGEWQATRWWVANGYRSGDMAYDYALVEIGPENGVYIGDALGYWSVGYGPGWTTGQEVVAMGYPSKGWFEAEGRNGTSQYMCDSTFESYSTVGSGYNLWIECPMNMGASGGPWFTRDANGQWQLRGVNSTCWGENRCAWSSWYLSTAFFDNRFAQFWNSVAEIRGGV
jgi:hypothetical protein